MAKQVCIQRAQLQEMKAQIDFCETCVNDFDRVSQELNECEIKNIKPHFKQWYENPYAVAGLIAIAFFGGYVVAVGL